MAKDYDKDALIADWKLGTFTVRELAKKYSISKTTVGTAVKNQDKLLGQLVEKQIEIKQELKKYNQKEKDKFFKEVDKRELELNFLDSVVMKNIQAVVANIDQGICNPQDLKANADTLDKAYISLRHAPRHSNQQVNVQTNVTNNAMSELIKETTGKVLRPS